MKWTNVGENLVRHPAGTIYLRAKVGGEKIRQSLETTDLRAAKRKRDAKLETLRHAATLGDRNIETLADALLLEKEITTGKPKLKQATKDYYEHIFAKLDASLPGHKSASTWTPDEAKKWWAAHCKDNPAPQHANNALGIVKRMMATVVERGIRRDNPLKGIKRLPIPKTRIDDLRHWFASHCIGKGIDVVTVAAWLGHKDGGKTLLATYAHHQKLHSLASAEKLGA